MNYKKVTFSIICDDEKHLEEVLNWYNKTYDTDFKVENIIYFNRYFLISDIILEWKYKNFEKDEK